MLGGLSCIIFSDRYNAVYDPEIFHRMMIKAVMAGSNLTLVVTANPGIKNGNVGT